MSLTEPMNNDQERNMIEAGIARHGRKNDALVKSGSAAVANDYSHLIKDHIVSLAEKIDEAREAPKTGPVNKLMAKLGDIPSLTVAYLSLVSVFNKVATLQTKRPAVANFLGSMIEDEIAFSTISDSDEKLWERLRTYALERRSYHFQRNFIYNVAAKEGIEREPWSGGDRRLIGALLLKMLEELGVITLGTIKTPQAVKQDVRLSEEILEWLDHRRESAEGGDLNLITPIYAPLTTVPNDWVSSHAGGYSFMRLPLVKGGLHSTNYDDFDMSRVFAAVNAVQRTPWQINRVMLAIIEDLWANGVEVGSLPTAVRQDLPGKVPEDVWEEMSADQRKGHRLKLREIHDHNRQAASNLASISQVMEQARALKTEAAIYIPYQLDWRGRVYAVPLLNQQGPDYIRSLFQFARPKPVGERGGMWLAIQCATLWDGEYRGAKLSKLPFQDRYDWAIENEEMLRGILMDPLGNTDWHKADKPFMFLRTVMDFIGFLDEGPEFCSGVPIALDGSCSGIQHYSALLRDPAGAASVNLLPSDQPADVYGDVAEVLLAEVKADEPSPERDFWLDFGIDRKVTKKPVMTYGYSSRRAGFAEWYESQFVRPTFRAQGRADNSGPFAQYLAKLTEAAVEKRLVAVAAGMEWMRTAAGLLAHEGKGMHWVTPTGFPVEQRYDKFELLSVRTKLKGEVLTVRVPTGIPTINKAKQKSSVSPNFIHSLDASHLMEVVLACKEKGLEHFALIHDSFGTMPADTDTMFATVRETFVAMYENHDPLLDLYVSVDADLSEEGRAKLPVPPKKGDLELSAVLGSLYAFA